MSDEDLLGSERSLEERHAEERRAVEEAGGGESEGFELAEKEMIEHTSHGDDETPSVIIRDADDLDEPIEQIDGEADEELKPD